jgi:hypothetical protein
MKKGHELQAKFLADLGAALDHGDASRVLGECMAGDGKAC